MASTLPEIFRLDWYSERRNLRKSPIETTYRMFRKTLNRGRLYGRSRREKESNGDGMTLMNFKELCEIECRFGTWCYEISGNTEKRREINRMRLSRESRV